VGLSATMGTEHLGLADALSALGFASIGMIITPEALGLMLFYGKSVGEKWCPL